MKDRQSKKVIPEFSKEQASKMIKDEPEQAADLLVVLTKTVNELSGKVDELTSKVEDLEGRLSKNSSNSSKPPSSDGYKNQHRRVYARNQERRAEAKKAIRELHFHRSAILMKSLPIAEARAVAVPAWI